MEQNIKKQISNINTENPITAITVNIPDDANLISIQDIIAKLNEFNKHKNKFIEQYAIFLEFHNNLLNNGIKKLLVRSNTYRQNFELNYGINSIGNFELHHIFGNRNSNSPEEIVALDNKTHKYYHLILDKLNLFYFNLVKRFNIIEDIEQRINFIKIKLIDRENIILLGQEIKNLKKYVEENDKNIPKNNQNTVDIPDKIIENQLKRQIDILKQFEKLSDREIVEEEIKKSKYILGLIDREIGRNIEKDDLMDIVRKIYDKFHKCETSTKRKINIVDIYNIIKEDVRNDIITGKDFENMVVTETVGYLKQIEQCEEKIKKTDDKIAEFENLKLDDKSKKIKKSKSMVKIDKIKKPENKMTKSSYIMIKKSEENRIKFMENRQKKLEELKVNLNELFSYKKQLEDRLNYITNKEINESASEIKDEKINMIGNISHIIENIVLPRQKNQKILIDYLKSEEFFNSLKEVINCIDTCVEQNINSEEFELLAV